MRAPPQLFPQVYGAAGHPQQLLRVAQLHQGAFQLRVLMTWGMRTNGHTAQSIEYHHWTELFRTPAPHRRGSGPPAGSWPSGRTGSATPRTTITWQQISNEDKWGQIEAPSASTWAGGSISTQSHLRQLQRPAPAQGSPQARQNKPICGPWPHYGLSLSTRTGDVDFGAGSCRWTWKAPNSAGSTTGSRDRRTGCWPNPAAALHHGPDPVARQVEWPLARTQWQKWHLHSGGGPTACSGTGCSASRRQADNPPDTFATTIRATRCRPWAAATNRPHPSCPGACDQRPLEIRARRRVVLCAPLDADLEVTGPVKIWCSTRPPTAQTPGLDRQTGGRAARLVRHVLCDGIVRARFARRF